jgi:hypothetical protein
MNHWETENDLVIEEKTLFRLIGWTIPNDPGQIYSHWKDTIPHSSVATPIYIQIATWKDGRWDE